MNSALYVLMFKICVSSLPLGADVAFADVERLETYTGVLSLKRAEFITSRTVTYGLSRKFDKPMTARIAETERIRPRIEPDNNDGMYTTHALLFSLFLRCRPEKLKWKHFLRDNNIYNVLVALFSCDYTISINKKNS